MRADRRGHGGPHGRGTSSLTFVGRRRSRWRLLVVLVALAAVPLAATALSGGGTPRAVADAPDGAPTAPDVTATSEAPQADAEDGVVPDAAEVAGTSPMARVGALELSLPAPAPLVVGYHEAAHVSATGMVPVGTLQDDRNTTRTSLPPDDPAGVAYLVLTSRGRAAGPTSAVDVVLPEGQLLVSPVTGTVVDVRDYQLYGTHADLRIEIVPDLRPDLRLVLIHIDGSRVSVGDRVVGGVTPIAATARTLPFSSHIDRETEPERFPHVHIELQPIDRPRPGDDERPDGTEEDDVVDEAGDE